MSNLAKNKIIFLVSKDNKWSRDLYENLSQYYDCRFYCDKSYREAIKELNPQWVFFFHWSHIVPELIYKNRRCVVIHTGNLPKNRGGSPLQNQIMDGIIESRVNAIEMVSEVDAGGIYYSLPITLQGNLVDIWATIGERACKIIRNCVEKDLVPIPQIGTKQVYKRRKDNEIKFDPDRGLEYIYDQIRMLDSKEYPSAYVQINNFKLEFSRSIFEGEEILTDVRIIQD